jgi:hypothetical protein
MNLGKTLIVAGLVLVVLGIFFAFGGKIPFLGKLPGDIRIEKDNFSFYFPITTCILLSVLLSLLLWLFRR